MSKGGSHEPMNSSYTADFVQKVSDVLQNHMRRNKRESMTADKCAVLLANRRILPAGPPKLGFNFRQMLRDGRDGKIGRDGKKIPLVTGAWQARPHTKWIIKRV